MRALMVGTGSRSFGCRIARSRAPTCSRPTLNLTLAGLRSDVALQSSGPIDCPIEIEPVADAQASWPEGFS
jgi:hypothetical protein